MSRLASFYSKSKSLLHFHLRNNYITDMVHRHRTHPTYLYEDQYSRYQTPTQYHQKRYYQSNQSSSKTGKRKNLKRVFQGIFGLIGGTFLHGSNYRSYSTESYESEQARIARRLEKTNLEVRTHVIGDGNCQFRAIADQIYGNQQYHKQVRYEIVNWLSQHPNSYVDPQKTAKLRDFLDTDRYPTWGHYIHYMSHQRAWGDEFTLIAAAQIYNVNIYIVSSVHCAHDKDAIRILYPQSGTAPSTIFLLHWHEKHFDSLQQKIKSSN